MYRPSKYNNHNDSLEKFSILFNKAGEKENVEMIYNEIENYSDDGVIILHNQNKKIYYDWEKRFKYFDNGKFAFNSLGQFERKFHKTPKIGITIQCDSSEENILVALHTSFVEKQTVSRITDTVNEIGGMRTTKDFYVYSYNKIDDFIAQLIKWSKAKEDFYDI